MKLYICVFKWNVHPWQQITDSVMFALCNMHMKVHAFSACAVFKTPQNSRW